MTQAENLLKLTIEYQASTDCRAQTWMPDVPGAPIGREPSVIAEEYGQALQSFLAP